MSQPNLIDLTGQRFGRWLVLEQAPPRQKNSTETRWLCQCDCGTVRAVNSQKLRSGKSQSCGCQRVNLHAQHIIKVADKVRSKVIIVANEEPHSLTEWAEISGKSEREILADLLSGATPEKAVGRKNNEH